MFWSECTIFPSKTKANAATSTADTSMTTRMRTAYTWYAN